MPLVEVIADDNIVVGLVIDGRRRRVRKGERVELSEDAAAQPLRRGLVELVEGGTTKAEGDEGLSKDELIERLDAAGVEYDKRWGVKKLAEALDGAAGDE